jgi:hypothetical protein
MSEATSGAGVSTGVTLPDIAALIRATDLYPSPTAFATVLVIGLAT